MSHLDAPTQPVGETESREFFRCRFRDPLFMNYPECFHSAVKSSTSPSIISSS